MNTIDLCICPPGRKPRQKLFSGPSSWKELTDRQGITLMRLRSQVDARPEVLFPALTLLYGLKPRLQRWLFDEAFLRRQNLTDGDCWLILENGQLLLDTLAWIGGQDVDATFPHQFRRYDYRFGSPFVWLKRLVNQTVYLGPAAGLGNCSFAEFMAADKAYREGNLPLLAAILYRPVNRLGERLAFEEKRAKQQASLFTDLEPALLQRIAFGFGCTMLNLQKAFRYVFPKKLTSDTDTSEKTDKTKSGTWLDVIIGMAKFDVTKVGEIEHINLYLALKVLNVQLQQAEEMEKQLEKMKQKVGR